MLKPLLKQHNDLTLADFHAHPIWMCVHGIDDEEPWGAESDELTHRPYDGPVPYRCSDPSGPMVLVRTLFKLADGTEFEGFSTPPFLSDDPRGRSTSYTQPQMFLADGTRIGFWCGARQWIQEEKERLYAALSKPPAEVFPIAYTPAPGLTDCREVLQIPAFGMMEPGSWKAVFEQ